MIYFALLKGINVTGHKTIKMAELKAMMEKLGFKNVRTYIQSGNVVFESTAKAEALKKKIENGISGTFGFKVTVVIRSRAEMEKLVKEYPFSKVKGHTECKISAGFLESVPEKALVKELESHSSDLEIIKVIGDNLYHLCRGNFSDSLLFKKNLPEKILKINCTIRNWNTVNKLLEL